ncbi:MAG: TolC family protein [Bacteroidales bacterium]|nr:TolC family protein [Bacteroidales bacterium]
MKKSLFTVLVLSAALFCARAQEPAYLSLDQILEIALSENASVRVADLEIERTGYARKGSYAALFPQIDGSGTYQRTIKKQVMYMDFELPGLGGGAGASESGSDGSAGGGSRDGFEVGRWNTWSAGVSATMPLVNAQLWKSLKISDQDVELAVEKARNSRLETVTQVKKAFYTVLLAKEALKVYQSVYENAVENLELTQKKYNAQRASELDLTRAKTALANAVPNMYDAANSVELSLWQLKAVMGVELGSAIDVAGSLTDYSGQMEESYNPGTDLGGNSALRQLSIQAEQLASAVKMQQYAYLPSLALAFSYSLNAMANDYNFSQYKWSPHSYVGLSLSIPIFSGGKRLNAVRQAKVQAAELDIQRTNTERQLQIAIRQLLGTMDTATKSYASAASAVESAMKAYSIARQSYDVGRSTLTDLNDAQLALTQAKLGECQAIFNYVSAKSDLEGTLGADFIGPDGRPQLKNSKYNE